jgi:hypothetical protein
MDRYFSTIQTNNYIIFVILFKSMGHGLSFVHG